MILTTVLTLPLAINFANARAVSVSMLFSPIRISNNHLYYLDILSTVMKYLNLSIFKKNSECRLSLGVERFGSYNITMKHRTGLSNE